jgi:hypothetical protein
VLLIVFAINALMFVVEFGAGLVARSSALQADADDMLGDALVYVLSPFAIGRGAKCSLSQRRGDPAVVRCDRIRDRAEADPRRAAVEPASAHWPWPPS